MMKIGRYEKTLMKGMNRKGGCIGAKIAKDGYSRQVKSLKRKSLIKEKGMNLCLSNKGKEKLK